ncbi:MAG: phenylalanine--tRNA ligase subunit alpha, partial [Geodermatophilaceae bacterium]
MTEYSYDPKQVALLGQDSLEQAAAEAGAAFGRAADLDALAALKPVHLGERAPVSLARRELGALPPQARADAGKRVNSVRVQIQQAYDEALAALAAQRDERVLREETVDVTLPWDRRP